MWVIFQENIVTIVRCYFKNADKIMNVFLFSFLFHEDELTPADEREGRAVKTVFKQNQVN